MGVIEASYAPGGSVDVLGPNGFQLSGTFTDAVSKIFPLDSEEISSFIGAFTGLLADGEHWQGTFGVDIHSLEPSPMFLQMSGPVSTPEPDTLGMMAFGLGALALLSQERRLIACLRISSYRAAKVAGP